MKLPFLKNRRLPRVAPAQPEEKMVNESSEDQLERHCIQELWDAIERKDVGAFRSAMEALILNLFEEDEEQDAAEVR